mgnify:CR=1 FL=1
MRDIDLDFCPRCGTNEPEVFHIDAATLLPSHCNQCQPDGAPESDMFIHQAMAAAARRRLRHWRMRMVMLMSSHNAIHVLMMLRP